MQTRENLLQSHLSSALRTFEAHNKRETNVEIYLLSDEILDFAQSMVTTLEWMNIARKAKNSQEKINAISIMFSAAENSKISEEDLKDAVETKLLLGLIVIRNMILRYGTEIRAGYYDNLVRDLDEETFFIGFLLWHAIAKAFQITII